MNDFEANNSALPNDQFLDQFNPLSNECINGYNQLIIRYLNTFANLFNLGSYEAFYAYIFNENNSFPFSCFNLAALPELFMPPRNEMKAFSDAIKNRHT